MSKMSQVLTVTFNVSIPDGVDKNDVLELIKYNIGEKGSLDTSIQDRLDVFELYDVSCLCPEDVEFWP